MNKVKNNKNLLREMIDKRDNAVIKEEIVQEVIEELL